MSEINNQPTYKRQRFLLAFIRQLHEGVTATDLQKLVFLHTMKEGSDFYEFIPYKFVHSGAIWLSTLNINRWHSLNTC